MKPNVDLTENRDFRNPVHNTIIRKPELCDFEPMKIEFSRSNKFYTGNAAERIAKSIEDSFGQADNICDCCGETIPWRFFNDPLCEACRKSFDMEQHSWR